MGTKTRIHSGDSYYFRVTNTDGRAGHFLSQESFTEGTYKMFFDTGEYFKQLAVKGFYPYVEVRERLLLIT